MLLFDDVYWNSCMRLTDVNNFDLIFYNEIWSECVFLHVCHVKVCDMHNYHLTCITLCKWAFFQGWLGSPFIILSMNSLHEFRTLWGLPEIRLCFACYRRYSQHVVAARSFLLSQKLSSFQVLYYRYRFWKEKKKSAFMLLLVLEADRKAVHVIVNANKKLIYLMVVFF